MAQTFLFEERSRQTSLSEVFRVHLFSKLFLQGLKPALSFKLMESLHLLQGIIYSFEVYIM